MKDEVTPGTRGDGRTTEAGALLRLTVRKMVWAIVAHTTAATSWLGAEARETRLALVLGVMTTYSLLLVPLVHVLGRSALIFSMLPVVVPRGPLGGLDRTPPRWIHAVVQEFDSNLTRSTGRVRSKINIVSALPWRLGR